jgi:site-specific DNA-methyltransferase (adenine-specific)
MPLVWVRTAGRCYTARPDRYFARGYDIALHALKGDPEMVIRNRPNVFEFAPVTDKEQTLLVERPVELYAELIKHLTHPGEKVADFFVGSGSVLAAAASLGRDYFGVEIDPERRAVAIKKIEAHLPDGD